MFFVFFLFVLFDLLPLYEDVLIFSNATRRKGHSVRVTPMHFAGRRQQDRMLSFLGAWGGGSLI